MRYKISEDALAIPDMKVGDLVKIGRNGEEYGLILWMHPTKGLMRVYWPDSNEIGYEKCIRVFVVSRI